MERKEHRREAASRAAKEYLATLDDAAYGAATVNLVSEADQVGAVCKGTN
jgi:hypothetical protein